MFKRLFAFSMTCIYALLIASLATGGEVRKLGSNDLEWGVGTTTSPGGKVVTKINAGVLPLALGDNTLTVNDALTAWIDVRAYGAIPDDNVDDTTALQSAIDAGISASGTVYLPIGQYDISAPLLIAKFSGGAYTYCSVSLVGGGVPFYSTTNTPKATKIVPTFDDAFVIGIQNGRGVLIRDILVYGKNDFSGDLTYYSYPELATNATYVTGTARDSRYSPYAGIVVDPFGTSVPADGGYPGMSAYYVATAAGSSHVIFDRTFVQGFVAGYAISPNGVTSNAEDISFFKCYSLYNKVGVSMGQTQSRNINWYGGANAFNLYCFDGKTYGLQLGSSPNIYGCDMAGKYLFNVQTDRGFNTYISGIHAESFSSIGFFGINEGGQHNDPVVFIGCLFDFNPLAGNYPAFHLVTVTPIKFIACTFVNSLASSYIFPLRFRYNRASGSLTFDSVGFSLESIYADEFLFAPTAGDTLIGKNEILFINSRHGDSSVRGAGKNILSHYYISPAANYQNKMVVPLGAELQYTLADTDKRYFVGGSDIAIDLGSLAVTDAGDGTASFTVSDNSVVRAGDLIYSSESLTFEDGQGGETLTSSWTCLGVITEVDGTSVTISGWPADLSSATHHLYISGWSRFHQATTGNINSNTTVDNVSVPSAWAVGNRIKGDGIPDGAYITNITDNTFTISKAATATTVGIRLYDADVYYLTGTAY